MLAVNFGCSPHLKQCGEVGFCRSCFSMRYPRPNTLHAEVGDSFRPKMSKSAVLWRKRRKGPLGSPRAFGGHLSRHLRGNFCSASKLSAALWSKTAARCFAFSSGHTSTVDSIPFGSIRTTCHPKALASYRSRFMFTQPLESKRNRALSPLIWAVLRAVS